MTVNRILRIIVAHKPVICLTTDLPNSHRTAYVGNDQLNAGITAGYMMGRVLHQSSGEVLMVVSGPYRVQQEREIGFRQILRSNFPQLTICERVNSRDDSAYSYERVMHYLENNTAPVGVYNIAGGNRGIARALSESGLSGKTVFIGHELTPDSKILLENDKMDFVIGHDVMSELSYATEHIIAILDGNIPTAIAPTPISIHTKFNCG